MYSASSTSEAAACPTSNSISTPLIRMAVFVRTATVISLCRHFCLSMAALPSKRKSHCPAERMVQ